MTTQISEVLLISVAVRVIMSAWNVTEIEVHMTWVSGTGQRAVGNVLGQWGSCVRCKW